MMDKYRLNKDMHTASFIKYFTLMVPSVELPDAFIITTLELWKNSGSTEEIINNTMFELQKNGKLIEFLDKIKNVFLSNIPQEAVLNTINAIYKNIEKYSNESIGGHWNTEWDKAEFLLLYLINNRIAKEEIMVTISKVLQETPDLCFAVQLLLSCKKDRGGSFYNIYEAINMDVLKEIVSKRLTKYYIEEKHNIFEEENDPSRYIFIIYQWATNWMEYDGHNKEMVGDYICSIFENNAKYFVDFIRQNKARTISDELLFNIDEIEKTCNADKLYQIAKKMKDVNSLSIKEKQVIDIFISNYDNRNK